MTRRVVIRPGDAYAVPLFGEAVPAQGAMFGAAVGAVDVEVSAGPACNACGGAGCMGSCGAVAVRLVADVPATARGLALTESERSDIRRRMATFAEDYRSRSYGRPLDDGQIYGLVVRGAEAVHLAIFELWDAEREELEAFAESFRIG